MVIYSNKHYLGQVLTTDLNNAQQQVLGETIEIGSP